MRMIGRLNTLKFSQCNTYESAISYCFYGFVQKRDYRGRLVHIENKNARDKAFHLQSANFLISNRCLLDVPSSGGLPHYSFQKASIHTWLQTYSSIFIALSESTPVITTQQFLTHIHDTSGLPWWATIATTTFFFRGAITAPLALYQQYISAKVENLKPELLEISQQLKDEINHYGSRSNWSNKKAMRIYSIKMRQEWRKLVERENCHPAKGALVILFQIPGWLFLSMSIRNLVSMRPFHDNAAVIVHNQLENEGLLWISNLTLPDSTLIVPTLITLCSLSIVELHALNQTKEPTRFQKYIAIFFRCIALVTFPLSALVPSCLSFYWLCSTAVGLGQNLVLMSPRLKSFAGIPKTNSALSNPYRHALDRLQQRLQRLRIGKV